MTISRMNYGPLLKIIVSDNSWLGPSLGHENVCLAAEKLWNRRIGHLVDQIIFIVEIFEIQGLEPESLIFRGEKLRRAIPLSLRKIGQQFQDYLARTAL